MKRDSKHAVALRKAAAEWAANLKEPVKDAHDRIGLKLNDGLMRAAVKYAEAERTAQ